MSKCIHCNYPYTTASKCPNCGSSDPSGISLGGCLIVVAVISVVIFFLSPGIFLTSFINYFIRLEINYLWFFSISLSLLVLGYVYYKFKFDFIKIYLLTCSGIVVFVLLLSLISSNNIFLNTLIGMFEKEITQTCERCGGDGELNSEEQKVFFQSDVLTEYEAVKEFQDWMDEQGKPWVEKDGKYWFMSKGSLSEPNRHLNGEGYGSFGPQTSKIYKMYKIRWWKSITSNKTNILCSKCCLKCKNSQK